MGQQNQSALAQETTENNALLPELTYVQKILLLHIIVPKSTRIFFTFVHKLWQYSMGYSTTPTKLLQQKFSLKKNLLHV